MALRFIDSVSHYLTAGVNAKYSNVSNVTIAPTGGRFGGGALDILSNGFVIQTLGARSAWVVGFAFNAAGFPTAGGQPIVEFLDQGTVQMDLRIYPDGTLGLTRAGTLLTGSLSTVALIVGVWN